MTMRANSSMFLNENNIECNAVKKKASLEEIIIEIERLNPDILKKPKVLQVFKNYLPKTKENKPWIVEGDLYMNELGISQLPESFGDLVINGTLYLNFNKLTSLPDRFGNLTVSGDLALNYNKLTSLPNSFCNLKVGGDLSLDGNKLTSLPDNFGNLKVPKGLALNFNRLTSLPDSFGNLEVGRYLWLSCNKLTSLPDNFANLKVGGELTIDTVEQLNSLPDNLNVGKLRWSYWEDDDEYNEHNMYDKDKDDYNDYKEVDMDDDTGAKALEWVYKSFKDVPFKK